MSASVLVLSKTTFLPFYPTFKSSHQERLKRLRRTILNTGNLLQARYDAPAFRFVMVTLTYAPGTIWQPEHISGYIKSVRSYLKRVYKITKLHYMWVMELQKRGAPHYHVLIRLRHGVTIPKPDLSGMWALGRTGVETARHAVGYISKYMSKGSTVEQINQIPKGARLHGASILNYDEMILRRWWNLPSWARQVIGNIQYVKKTKGGFLLPKSGQFFPTPYKVEFEHGLIKVTLNAQVVLEYGYELAD